MVESKVEVFEAIQNSRIYYLAIKRYNRIRFEIIRGSDTQCYYPIEILAKSFFEQYPEYITSIYSLGVSYTNDGHYNWITVNYPNGLNKSFEIVARIDRIESRIDWYWN